MASIDQLDRLTNLTFAFLNTATQGEQYLTVESIKKKVPGYACDQHGQQRTDSAINRLIHRDVAKLVSTGVPIETLRNGTTLSWQLDAQEYPLPAVQFTQAEATVLRLAGKFGTVGELATFARSGWMKLAASGATAQLGTQLEVQSRSDIDEVSSTDLELIVQACRKHQRLGFYFQRTVAADLEPRWMDPWGLITYQERVYLVGFDLERQAPRTFRYIKLSDFEAYDADDEFFQQYGPFHLPPDNTSLHSYVIAQLQRNEQRITAVVRIQDGHGAELRAKATMQEDDRYTLVDVDANWLKRQALILAPAVVVLEPEDLRNDIRAIFAHLAAEEL
ncbi:YafY family protein [Corynebacterium sp. HS2168-gen11]|uniref:helix-turn-helix transcriptional regulator n=1 Tax=Corynebacterium sp. HS2168-gen11 TaxID=2974027 RepID=UPI00216B381B|nr:WYL domain-containing protein [Corynebacterium sp. HS2168-gen11]MCS4535079.1 WYL domain-containing protein [Corynebacterium sp. HS2168-gen11]